MLIKNVQVQADEPITVQVGEVVFQLTRIGPGSVRLGIDAPRHLEIDVNPGADGRTLKDAVEKAILPVVEK